MSGHQKIRNYEGAYLGSQYTMYRSCATKSHVEKARDWVKTNIHGRYSYQGHQIVFDSGWWDKLSKEAGLRSIALDIDSTTSQCGWSSYSVSSGTSRIVLSKWCTSYGVIRAIIMHEFAEVYAGIHIFGLKSSQTNADAHNLACNVVNQFSFEDTTERVRRNYNFESCKVELDGICWELQKRNKGIKPVWDWHYRDASVLVNRMKQMSNQSKYIPGYFEVYERNGAFNETKAYRNPSCSSIANLFAEARRRGIKPSQQYYGPCP